MEYPIRMKRCVIRSAGMGYVVKCIIAGLIFVFSSSVTAVPSESAFHLETTREDPKAEGRSASEPAPVKVPITKRYHIIHESANIGPSCAISKCHRKRLKAATYVHTPVAAAACVTCHGPVAPNPPFGLTRTGQDICLGCHGGMRPLLKEAKTVHKPVKEACIGCHDPHGSESKVFLKEPEFTLCVSCHEKTTPDRMHQIENANAPHGPVAEGKCADCHTPHASNFNKLLKEGPKEAVICLSCHKETVVFNKRTTALTRFRNGNRNLHYLHVKRERGRTCLDCHEVHAGYQARTIRVSTPFGDWDIPIKFSRTETGGRCAASCHIGKQYDRKEPFQLEIDKQELAETLRGL